MPKKKNVRKAPDNYWDMKDSVEKDKKVKMKEVFGVSPNQPKNKKKSNKKKL